MLCGKITLIGNFFKFKTVKNRLLCNFMTQINNDFQPPAT